MIKRIINKEFSSITSAAFVIGVMTLTAKLLGVFRDSIFAHHFPVNDLDVYYAAFRIPDFIYNIIVLGALSAGFIPVFTKMVADDKEDDAFKAANNVLNILFTFLTFFTLIAIALAPQIIALITPGFDPVKQQRTVELTRIMFLSPLFMLISSITGGILQSYKRFLIYSLSPIIYNLGIIFGAMFLVKDFGFIGLAYGVVIGAFFQLAIQLPSIKMLGFKYKFFIDMKSQEVRTIFRMMIPRFLTIIVSQINLLIITIVASTLAGGSLTMFTFANNLQAFPLGIFAVSFAVAAFPAMSALSGKEQREDFTRILLSTTKQILYFIIPLSIFMVVFRAQIIRVIYGHGYFGWDETITTINALQIFCVSLFAQSLVQLFTRAFWALHDSRTPFLTNLFAAIINVILMVLLSARFGLYGLVAAFSTASIIDMSLLFLLLKKKTLAEIPREFYLTIGKIVLSAVGAGFVGRFALYAVEPFLDTHTFFGITVQGVIAGVLCVAFYLFMSSILNIEEFKQFKNSFQCKVFKTGIKTTEIIPEE